MTTPTSKFAKCINFSQAQNLKPFTPAQRTGKEQAHDPQML